MAARGTSATKKRKVGVRNCTDLEEYEISTIGINIKIFRCSGCKRIPDKEIFHCLPEPHRRTYQHLVCDICNHVNNICPMNLCLKGLVRNIMAETILDQIRFKCPWTGYGCTEENISRAQLTSHQNECEMNPNLLNCSYLFGSKCDYKFFTVFENDENKVKEMKEHILSHNQNIILSQMKYGDHKDEKFTIAKTKCGVYVTQILDWIKFDPVAEFHGQKFKTLVGTSISVWLVDTDVNQTKTISRYYISLAEDRSKTKTEVQSTIKSESKLDIPSKCLANLKWNVMNLSFREFKEILMLTPQERILRNYSIPVAHLQNYFANENGEIILNFCPGMVN